MVKNKITVSKILNNQFPLFVRENYPLVIELFEQYYKSQEIPGASLDLLNNIDQYIKLDNNTNLIEETYLFKSDDDSYFVDIFDDTIYVKSVDGFSEKNGLIQIDDEIITYESIDKENNAFINCSRGFSGIEEFNNQRELVFVSTLSDQHLNNPSNPTKVKNLNILFLKQFLSKLKNQFSPGFDSRELYKNDGEFLKLNENIFVKQASDFYSSKGTENSFKILFKALFNSEVKLITPRDFLIEPSNAQYRVTRNLVVESISGNPLDLTNRTLFQEDSNGNIEAYGSVTKVEKIIRENTEYFIVSLDYDFNKDINVSGSIFGNFSIHPKSQCVDFIVAGSSTITVDSTVGFSESGELVVDFEDEQLIISYQSKSLNQFYNCSGITRDIPLSTEIKSNLNAFAYVDNQKTEKILIRIGGVLESIDIESENNQLYNIGDTARVTSYGIKDSSVLFDNWIYNIPVSYIIEEDDLIPQGFLNGYRYEILTKDINNIYDNDSVELDFSFLDVNGSVVRSKKIFSSKTGSIPKKSIQITNDNEIVRVFKVRKLITKVPGYDFTANIQNTYKDPEDGQLYVAAQSLPNYFSEDLQIKDRSVPFNGYFSLPEFYDSSENNSGDSSGELIIFRNKNGILKNHGFITGDAIVYIPGSGDNVLNIQDIGTNLTNVYYVKKIDNNSIKIALSRENVYNSIFLKISGNLSNDENKFVLYKFCDQSLNQKILGPQKIIRNIRNVTESDEKEPTKYGSIGIFANGVELLNYKSEDVIYSGKIEHIDVTYGGENYDVINPPILEVEDPLNQSNSKVTGLVSVEGSLKSIDVINPGFDFVDEPKIDIVGGSGFGAKAKVNLIPFIHSIEFNASISGNLDISNSSIILNVDHNFHDGERVVYNSNGQTTVGSLVNQNYYFISVIDSKEFKLHETYNDAINNTNPKSLTYSSGNHTIKSIIQKKKIDSVTILDSGSGYKNNKKIATSSDVKIEIDVIEIKNHGYISGEIINYYSENPIGGLENNTSYYVTKLDDDRFKLSSVFNDINNKDFLYKTKQYIKFTDAGSGEHEFNYSPIIVSVTGKTRNPTKSDQNFDAVLRANFRGSIKNITITNSGVGYGSTDIINYNKQPSYQLISGYGARLKPIIIDGKIKDILIQNSGQQYNSTPEIIVEGSGFNCKLNPNLSEDGRISSISIVNEGFGYDENTRINVVSSGANCKLLFKIQSWTVNLVNRLIFNNQISNDDSILTDSRYANNDLQYAHAYAPRKLRGYTYSKNISGDTIRYRKDIDNDLETSNFYHSPIIGWAYDGCPIYGPYGYENPSGGNGGKVIQMRSGYNAYDNDIIIAKPNRPSINLFPLGFFVEDYDFIGNGNLDEFNGRFCKTPEFPNGVYAYFTTVSSSIGNITGFTNDKKPIFPYVIGNYFKFKPIDFNFNRNSTQDSIKIENTNWNRNTLPYNINSEYSNYDFIPNTTKSQNIFINVNNLKGGKIDNINISAAGEDYSVGDPIIFDEENNGSIYANVSKIIGKDVTKIESNAISIPNVEFTTSPNTNQIIGFTGTPHNLLNGDKIYINNLNNDLNLNLNQPYTVTNLQNTLVLLENIDNASVTGIITTFKVFGSLTFPKIKENDIYLIENEKIKILSIDATNSNILVEREYDDTISDSHLESSILLEQPRKFFFNVDNPIDYTSVLNDELYFNPQKSFGVVTSLLSIPDTFTLFLSTKNNNTPVNVQSGSETIFYFTDTRDLTEYRSGYVDIVNSTDPLFNSTKKKIISIGSTSIIVDYDTSSYSGIGVTCFLNKWSTVDIPSNTIYLPNHNLNTGDRITYNANSGSIISTYDGLSIKPLQNNTQLYIAKVSDDLIGISTSRMVLGIGGTFVGIGTSSSSLLYFTNFGTGTNHSFKTIKDTTLIGNIINNKSTVYTETNHNLSLGDSVNISCFPEDEKIISIKYDEISKKVLLDPNTIFANNVNVFEDTITIENHGYFTGQKVLYSNDGQPIDGLENLDQYYVYVVDFDTIKLCSSYYNSTLRTPVTVGIASTSIDDSFLYKINPNLNLIKNNKIVFDLSDPSLSFFNGIEQVSAFDFKLFKDSKYLYEYTGDINNENNFIVRKYGEIGISPDARVEIFAKDLDIETLYYQLIPTKNSPKIIFNDFDVIDNNKINFVESYYNGSYNIIEINDNKSFSIALDNAPESPEYSNNIEYDTTSKSAIGGIKSVFINLAGSGLKKLPSIIGVSSKDGFGAILYPQSKNIGEINSYKINDIGFNYSSDISIRPKIKFPSIVKVEPLTSIEKIEVVSVGINYKVSPILIAIDSNTNKVIDDLILDFDLGEKVVKVIQNTKGIYNVEPRIISTNNSNGISVKSLSYDSDTKTITAVLSAYYDSFESYPFRLGDKILVEGSRNLDDGVGYNSSKHNYSLFTVVGLADTFGSLDSIVQYQFTYGNPGTFDPDCTSATVVPEKYLPVFSTTLKKNKFLVGEIVQNGRSTGIVENWDAENELLKIDSSDIFDVDTFISGKTSGTIGRISQSTFCSADCNISASSIVNNGWNSQKGYLNSPNQRIHDSDYYQYFSYSINSDVSFEKWNDSVSSLNHTSGFKKFSDLNIQSIQNNSGISTDQNFQDDISTVDIIESVDFNCINDFDLVFENNYEVDSIISSDQVYFNSRELQDYSESRGNRVLVIDDIGDLFNTDEREERFVIVDKDSVEDINTKKYIILTRDKQIDFNRQVNIVTALNDGNDAFLNQYGRVETDVELGSYDIDVSSGVMELKFYPNLYEFNDYDISYINYGFNKNLTENSEVSFGNVARIFGTESPVVGSSSTTIIEVDDVYRVVKVITEVEDIGRNIIQYDEFTLLNDNNTIHTLQYGNLCNKPVGIGSYSAYLSGNNIKVDFIPNSTVSGDTKSRSFVTLISDFNYSGIGTELLITTDVSSQSASIIASSSPTLNNIAYYTDDSSAAHYIISIEDITNQKYQVSEILLVNDSDQCYFTEYGGLYTNNILGTFDATKIADQIILQFEPNPDIDVEIRLLQTTLRIPNRFITDPSFIV